MIFRKLCWFGSLAVVAGGLLLALSAVESQAKSATILSTASNSGETSPCG
jgi:hypothetical protein